IVSFLKPQIAAEIPDVTEFKEQVGAGIEGTIYGRKYVLRPLRSANRTAVGIYCDGILVGEVHLGDRLRDDSAGCIEWFKKSGFAPFVLSGDNKGAVESVASEAGIPLTQVNSCADPESKQKFIESHERSLMVGDGANDALALSAAFVGIAVQG